MQHTSSEKIGNIINAFTEPVILTLSDIKTDYDLTTENGKHGLAWDIRFNRIKTRALLNNFVVLTKKRNNLWSFICVLDDSDDILYVFVKNKNLMRIKKEFGKNSIHYFHAIVSLDGKPHDLNELQLSLFPPLSQEYELNRLLEVKKVLGDDHLRVKEVRFIVAKEEDRQIVGAEVHKYDRYFNLTSIEDYSNYVSLPTVNEITLNSELTDEKEQQVVIPKIKDSLKKQQKIETKLKSLNKEKEVQETKNKI
ncbi:DUF5986 family protein [Exiguobacterium sp. s22]|uniref:DUF5986 family protein n=1 Tax=Exiguobacterium sp. s22 TaxID=2751272 RepID=UPI001BEB9360